MSHIMLGESTNLIDSFNASAFLSNAVPFTPSVKPALFEQQAIVSNPNHQATWSWPVISLHPNAEDLLSALMQIKIRPCSFEDKPSEGGGNPKWPVGALVLAGLTTTERATKLKELSDAIQLDLKAIDTSYVLVLRTRLLGSAVHPCCKNGIFRLVEPADKILRPETLQALKNLQKLSKTGTDVNKEGADGYLQFYNTFGSHFVSSIDVGDFIFQVSTL